VDETKLGGELFFLTFQSIFFPLTKPKTPSTYLIFLFFIFLFCFVKQEQKKMFDDVTQEK
jgi:hypothetical protein